MVVDHTLDMLNKAQRASVGLAADTFGAVVHATKTGLTQPDELVKEMAGFVSATGDMLGMAAQPLAMFIQRQQELADAMANLAELHSQLADVVATVARRFVPNCSVASATKTAQYPLDNPSSVQQP